MNIITHECAYSLYPDLTFIERISLFNSPIHSDEKEKAAIKYEERGWLCVPAAHQSFVDDSRHSLFPGLRSVGDDKCWKVYLYPKQQKKAGISIDLNTWSQSFDEDLKPTISFSITNAVHLNLDFIVGNTVGSALIHRLDARFADTLTLTL